MTKRGSAYILKNKDYKAPPVFLRENLLREARRQKSVQECNVPKICVLDPDGDLADYFLKKGKIKKIIVGLVITPIYTQLI